MDWWIWVIAGLVLLAIEAITPGGFFMVFFSAGALVVGALVGFGFGGPVWFQWILFSLVSLGSMVFLRHRFVRLASGDQDTSRMDSLVGEIAVVRESLLPASVGKVELRGTAWTARNVGDKRLREGDRCRVDNVDGLTLLVRAE